MHRTWIRAATIALALLSASLTTAHAQIFLSSAPHPRFTIGPLFIVATVRPDLGPVSVRVSWGITVPPTASVNDIGDALYLFWPGEIARATMSGPADPAVRRHVEQRGFTVVTEGLLALESRDRTKLGTPGDGTPVDVAASFVTFHKAGTNPAQSGIGTYVKIPWTPRLADSGALMSLPMTVKDMITPKPATWVEETFWGRRNVLTLNAGSVGTLALYSLYFEERARIVRLAQDFSQLVALFTDSDHLRVEEIAPASAIRRPSRIRAGVETVSIPITGSESTAAQALRVQFAYFSGPIAWRPEISRTTGSPTS